MLVVMLVLVAPYYQGITKAILATNKGVIIFLMDVALSVYLIQIYFMRLTVFVNYIVEPDTRNIVRNILGQICLVS